MSEVIVELLCKQYVWVPAPGLQELLPRLSTEFSRMLDAIPFADIEKGKYKWQHKDSSEPDDGIILKQEDDTTDPSIAKYGMKPDNKVYIQGRRRTQGMFVEHHVYDEQTQAAFFDLLDLAHDYLEGWFTDFLGDLWKMHPELGLLTFDRDRTVVRVMRYLDVRPDDPSLIGKRHTDKNDVTAHLYDTHPGLLLKPEAESDFVAPTRPGQMLLFVSDRLVTRGLPVVALNHGAVHDPLTQKKRQIVVCFAGFNPRPA